MGAHLYNTATRDIGLHYWRGRSREVDFVLQQGPRLVAFEVKSGPTEVELSGMREFENTVRASTIGGGRGGRSAT